MKLLNFFLICAIMAILSSCIEDYTLPSAALANYKSEVVIQGRILRGGETIIYMTQTQPMGTVLKQETQVKNAKIKVIGQNGYQSEYAEYDSDNRYYVIDTKDLPNNTQYALQAEANGETYQSEFLTLLETPDIEDVNYKELEDGISIHVSARNSDDESRYYMWSYEEDWEFTATYDLIALGTLGRLMYNKNTYNELTSYVNPYYRCWKHDESQNILIYTTKDLNQNAVKDVELLHIPIDDSRISYIYSILVKQYSLSEDAYSYYASLKKFSEESSGLFTPMPYEVKGNIKCTSNPNTKAKGYVLASNIKTKRIFIYESDFKNIYSTYHDAACNIESSFDAAKRDDMWTKVWNDRVLLDDAVIMSPNNDMIDLGDMIYSKGCVDCRFIKGANKKRPYFWPNNHE